MESPFIIWTFRRTGGTNLGQALFKASKFNNVEHEPFNLDRVFGHVVREWKKHQDKDALRQAIDEILSKKVLIKHCLEILPQELNETLAELSQQHGYKHLFLFRELPKDRLLSLNYAQQTGVWGSRQKKRITVDENVFTQRIETNKLLHHEEICRSKMKAIYELLLSKGAEPRFVSFENLYQASPFEYSIELTRQVFEYLIGDCSQLQDNYFRPLLKRGGQGTKSDYLKFQGADEFVTKVAEFGQFLLEPIHEFSWEKHGESDHLLHLSLWSSISGVCKDQYYFSGAALFDIPIESLSIYQEGSGMGKIFYPFPSPRLSEMFPDNSQAKNCRFLAGPFTTNSEFTIVAQEPTGKTFSFCKVSA